jgi:peptidoglycan/xylan/chitin deacetylase (PgdA/CDA1 family)
MSGGALVLTYHAVEDGPPPLCVPPPLFERHLDCIAASGLRAVTVSALAEAISGGEPLDGLVAITFDDGFASVAATAWPLLMARGLTATVFCVAGYVGRESDWPTQPATAPRRPLATRDELAELAEAGAELGAHGLSHSPLDTDDPHRLEQELVESKHSLESTFGRPFRTFAWPYGVHSDGARRTARRAGYLAACGASPGLVRPGEDLFALPRVDAHYVRRPSVLAHVLSGRLPLYLAARRHGARARRLVRPDHAAASPN